MNTDNTSYESIWAVFQSLELTQQNSIFIQLTKDIQNYSLAGVVDTLSGANDKVKSYVWGLWAKKADLTAYGLQEIVAIQETEPYNCVYSIVEGWLNQVDLSKYSLPQMTKTVALLRTKGDITKAWQRWINQADLSFVSWKDIVKAVQTLAPEVMAIVLCGYKQNSGNWGMYTKEELQSQARSVPDWVITKVNQVVPR